MNLKLNYPYIILIINFLNSSTAHFEEHFSNAGIPEIISYQVIIIFY